MGPIFAVTSTGVCVIAPSLCRTEVNHVKPFRTLSQKEQISKIRLSVKLCTEAMMISHHKSGSFTFPSRGTGKKTPKECYNFLLDDGGQNANLISLRVSLLALVHLFTPSSLPTGDKSNTNSSFYFSCISLNFSQYIYSSMRRLWHNTCLEL